MFYIGEYNPKSHMVESFLREDFVKDSLGKKCTFNDFCEIIDKSNSNGIKQRALTVVNNAIRALNMSDYLDNVILVKIVNKEYAPSLLDYNDMKQGDGFIQYIFETIDGNISVIETYIGRDLFTIFADNESLNKYKEIVGV